MAIDVDAIRARAEAAAEGPWWPFLSRTPGAIYMPDSWTVHSDERFICDLNVDTHEAGTMAEFIAHAREDVPYLLDEVERLRAERDALWAEAESKSCLRCTERVRTERDRAEATLARVQELVDNGMRHVYVEQDDEYGVLCSDIRAAIEGTDS